MQGLRVPFQESKVFVQKVLISSQFYMGFTQVRESIPFVSAGFRDPVMATEKHPNL
jgi:hypothetical protein